MSMNPLMKPRNAPLSSATSGKPCAASKRRSAGNRAHAPGTETPARSCGASSRWSSKPHAGRDFGRDGIAEQTQHHRPQARGERVRRGRRMLVQRALDGSGPAAPARVKSASSNMRCRHSPAAAPRGNASMSSAASCDSSRADGVTSCGVVERGEFVVIGTRFGWLRLIRLVARARRDQRTETRHAPTIAQDALIHARGDLVLIRRIRDERLAHVDHRQRRDADRAVRPRRDRIPRRDDIRFLGRLVAERIELLARRPRRAS